MFNQFPKVLGSVPQGRKALSAHGEVRSKVHALKLLSGSEEESLSETSDTIYLPLPHTAWNLNAPGWSYNVTPDPQHRTKGTGIIFSQRWLP